MKVLIINPSTKDHPIARDMAGGLGFAFDELLPPLDLAYCAAVLLKDKFDVDLLDADGLGLTNKELLNKIVEIKPEFIIVNVSLVSMRSDCGLIKQIREITSGSVIAKTTLLYLPLLEKILVDSGARYCIVGEAEGIVSKILKGETNKATVFLKEGKISFSEFSELPILDDLPFPARSLLPNKVYGYSFFNGPVATIQTSRGCPFPCCYYCPYPLIQGNKWRARSPENVYKEIKEIVEIYGVNNIFFRDAVFTFDLKRAEKICDLIIENNLSIQWWCETRVDRLDENLLTKMKISGCLGINIGVETGDAILMEKQAKVGVSLDKLRFLVKLARKVGVKLHFLLITGIPGETKESYLRTFDLLKELKPDSIGVTLITPYPGTPLYEEAIRKKWIEVEDFGKYDGNTAVMRTDDLSVRDIWTARWIIRKAFFFYKKSDILSTILGDLMYLFFKIWTKI